jgi:hypothetical protein
VSFEDDKCSGLPSISKTTENVDRFGEHIHEDHRQTIRELTDTIGISYGVCQEILTENVNMCLIAVKFVPKLLTNNEKQWRLNVCLELLERSKKDPTFISRIIMVMKVGFTVMIQKQSNSLHSGRADSDQEQKGLASPEFNIVLLT